MDELKYIRGSLTRAWATIALAFILLSALQLQVFELQLDLLRHTRPAPVVPAVPADAPPEREVRA